MENDPTGLLAGFDVEALRRKTKRAPFAAIYEEIRRAVGDAIAADGDGGEIVSRGWCHSQYFTPQVLEAGFVARISGDAAAAAHVARQIDKLARVYSQPPASFARYIPGFQGKPTAYFSNAHTILAARMCRAMLPDASYRRLCNLARAHLIADAGDPPYFFTHWNAGHNAVITHAIAGAIAALTLGEEVGHPDTEKIIEWGRDACEMFTHWALDEQGVPFEGPMYGLVTAQWVYLMADLLQRHGRENLFVTLPRLEAFAQAAAEMQLPGLVGISGFNDCRRLITQETMPWLLLTERHYHRPLDLALWHETARPPDPTMPHQRHSPSGRGLLDLLWWDGRKPDQPVASFNLPIAFVGRGAAVAVLRTSWRSDAVCACVLGQGRSHNVPDHTHADAGHFSIHAYGDYLAYDTAYYNFDEDTHSVVLIDGKPHRPTKQGNLHQGRFDRVRRDELLDHVSIDAAAAKGCMWARRDVLFVRGGDDFAYLVTLDKINPDVQTHTYQWQLQGNLHTRIGVTGPRSANVIGERARLECTFFNPLPRDVPTLPHTMRVFADHHPHRQVWTGEPETNPRLVAEQFGANCTIMAIVVPRRVHEPAVRVTDATAYRTACAYVEHGPWIDQIVFASDHIHVRLPDLRASSEIVVVRRRRDGRVVSTWTCDGKSATPSAGSAREIH